MFYIKKLILTLRYWNLNMTLWFCLFLTEGKKEKNKNKKHYQGVLESFCDTSSKQKITWRQYIH